MRKYFFKLDLFFEKHRTLLFFFTLIVILRLPNFFEPYWYGDEAIYLTIGNALRFGERLYADIIDHKTPLIYLLAMTPSQFSFRALLLGWMILTTACFWQLLIELKLSKSSRFLTMLFFVLATTLPSLEGNIPNGELFLMIWSFLSLFFFLKGIRSNKVGKWLFLSGVAASLSILTKVPGLFDLAPIGLFTVVYVLKEWQRASTFSKNVSRVASKFAALMLPFIAGVAAPVVFCLVFFASQSSLPDFFQFGVLYNFRYAGSWQPQFPSQLIAFFFKFPVKVAFFFGSLAALIALRQKLSTSLLFFASWFVAALFATTLSNRPYPHYFMQIVPPLAGLLGESWLILTQLISRKKHFVQQSLLSTVIVVYCLASLSFTAKYLGLFFYPTWSYYSRFVQLATGQITAIKYQDSFDSLVADNRKAAAILVSDSEPYLFIWGTNPMLYAQTYKNPTGRFTVSFHIHDFKAYDDELRSLKLRHPEYIVVMNDEKNSFPDLNTFLRQKYLPTSAHFDHFSLWKRLQPKDI